VRYEIFFITSMDKIEMQKLMIGFSLIGITLSSLRGLSLGAKHEAHVAALKRLIRIGQLTQYEEQRSEWQWKSAVHAHATLFCLVTIIVALTIPHMGYTELMVRIMGGLFIMAPILWSIFGWWFNKPLLALGDFCFILAMGMSVIGVFTAL
jgi:hypothetical protein